MAVAAPRSKAHLVFSVLRVRQPLLHNRQVRHCRGICHVSIGSRPAAYRRQHATPMGRPGTLRAVGWLLASTAAVPLTRSCRQVDSTTDTIRLKARRCDSTGCHAVANSRTTWPLGRRRGPQRVCCTAICISTCMAAPTVGAAPGRSRALQKKLAHYTRLHGPKESRAARECTASPAPAPACSVLSE